jgi:hypothetical protein
MDRYYRIHRRIQKEMKYQPYLIYDDRCYSCTKFAKYVNIFSRGWIRNIGHYQEEGIKIKNIIWSDKSDLDNSLKMSWLITKDHVYGARSEIIPIIKEIIIGWFNPRNVKNTELNLVCNYVDHSCMTTDGIRKRICSMMKNHQVILHDKADQLFR